MTTSTRAPDQRESGHGPVRGRASWESALHAVPMDRARAGQRRHQRFLRHRDRLAAHLGQRLRCACAIHAHLDQNLRPEWQRNPPDQSGAADDVVRRPLLRQGPVQRRRQLGLRRELSILLFAVHGGSGWPAISSPFQWLTASAHLTVYEGLQVYVEGKNLTNSVARTYLNGNPSLPWAPGQSVGQSSSGVGYGYSAYGRTYTIGASYRF